MTGNKDGTETKRGADGAASEMVEALGVAKGSAKKKATKRNAKAPSAETSTETPKKRKAAPKETPEVLEGGDAKNAVAMLIPIADIRIVAGLNPRKRASDDLKALIASIKSKGILQAPVVAPVPGKKGVYDLVVGERRLCALKVLKAKEVMCNVRRDLADDGTKERKCARIATAGTENSGECRKELTTLELAHAAQALKEGSEGAWSVERVGKELSVGVRTIRRSLELLDAPKYYQDKVIEGEMALTTALEAVKFDDPATQQRIKAALVEHPGMTRDEIRRLGKKVAQEGGAMPTTTTSRRKKGTDRAASLVTYRCATDKNVMLADLSFSLRGLPEDGQPSDESEGSVDFHMLRGAIGALLWDLCERNNPVPPVYDPDPEDNEEYEDEVKDLEQFNARVKELAARHKPKADKE